MASWRKSYPSVFYGGTDRSRNTPKNDTKGRKISLPHSRPMPVIGKSCHELRIIDKNVTWRIIYHIGDDAIVILEVFTKKSKQTPKNIIEACTKRMKRFYS
jgi:phage-related protein